MKLTLLQQKNRPIHKLRPRGKSVVAFTYCGVEPCRKGVRTEGVNVGQMKATCKHCLAIEAKEKPKMKVTLAGPDDLGV